MGQPQSTKYGLRLNVADGAEHRALPDAMVVKDVFLALLRRPPTVNTIADLKHFSQPLTFADAPVLPIEPPAGFEALAMAMAERCAITIIYTFVRADSKCSPARSFSLPPGAGA